MAWILPFVHVEGRSFHVLGIEPASQQLALQNLEALFSVVDLDETTTPSSPSDPAARSPGLLTVCCAAGIDFVLSSDVKVERTSVSVFETNPGKLDGVSANVSQWTHNGVMYFAVPLREILSGNTMTIHASVT